MIFETHAHYEDARFDGDRDVLLDQIHANGISTIVNVASSIETTKKSIRLAEQYEYIYASIGVHPSDVKDLDEENFRWLLQQAEHPKVVAFGEIGLDYYWEKEEKARETQRYWFRRQLQAAWETGLAAIIHSRDAAQDTLTILKEAGERQIPGVIHCFSYSAQMAQEYVRMGYYIGIGGVVTFQNAKKLREVAASTPIERIVLETDCPYMAPEPFRGKRNSSEYLPYIAAKIAEIKGIAKQEVIEVTRRNASRLYHMQE